MDHEILERIFDGSIKPRDLKLSTLESITDNFSRERIIGEGGFGTVYKGVLRNGEVALKRIRNNHTMDEKLFRREVDNLLDVSHKNVVRFLGFCSEHKAFMHEESGEYIYAEDRERILCFEYINNGSLTDYISDELRGLQWDSRYLIIKGICKGLQYLHMEKHINHMDLKPANILIDDNMVPKVTDFGLSRMLADSRTISSKRFLSLEYVAPEYLSHGRISFKTDVYSLGIIIIELVIRRWRHRWQKSGEKAPFPYQQIAKLIEIELLCLEKDPYKRPSMSDIIRDINELDSTDSQIDNADKSTIGQIGYYWEDDMLGIEPLELCFPFELNSQISCSLELTNDTNAFIAFSIQSMTRLPYSIQPNKDIVAPFSKCSVNITLEPLDYAPQDRQYIDDFIVLSTEVNESLISEDINDIFREEGKLVDLVKVKVNYKAKVPQESNVPPTEAESMFYRDDPGQSIILSKSSSTSRPFSGHAEASRSTHTNDNLSAAEPMVMTFQELHRITDGFSEKRLLGEGGFGTVYKGVLDNGEVIAVKKLHNTPGLVEVQFKNELLNLMMVKHENIIRLVGYCSEAKQIVNEHKGKKDLFYREERALCLEYLQGGNLEELLSGEEESIVTTGEADYDNWCRPESSLTPATDVRVIWREARFQQYLDYLDEITDGFCPERLIGEGLHSKVYKADCSLSCAVSTSRLQALRFQGVNTALKVYRDPEGYGKDMVRRALVQPHDTYHPNVVTLFAYCLHDSIHSKFAQEYDGSTRESEAKAVAIICTEYVPNGPLQRYISDISCGLDWYTRYGIIIGTCQGLRFLHEDVKIIHMNLTPRKILLDKDMVPKISDFRLSRSFGDEHCKTLTVHSMGPVEYMPPEFIDKQVISTHYDIYSLGIIIIEITTGSKYNSESCEMSSKVFIERALENWRKRLQRTVKDTLAVEAYCQVVKICLEVAFKCIEHDRLKRPTILEIIEALGYGMIPVEQNIDYKQLDVQPLELCFFPLGRKKGGMGSCSLQLNNRGDDRVAFMLVASSPKRYLTKKPICGIVPPRCTYTIPITMTNKLAQLSKIGDFFTLYGITLGEYDLRDVDKGLVNIEYDKFFNKARARAAEDGEEVQEVMLKAICDQPVEQGTSSSKPTRPTVEVITTPDAREISSMDMHPTEPWIMTMHHVGSLRFWNYKTMETLNSFHVTDEPVHAAKFSAREKWVVAGDGNGCIHVYSYGEQEDVESFDAHDSCITSLAVHPTHSFVISSSSDDDHLIKLWDWSKDWKCTQTFRGHTDRVTQVTFNPTDNDTFTSASWDGTIKIWSMCSDDPSIVMTLDGKVDSLLCVDYFTRLDRQYLIAGCKDKTAQIWELGKTEGCVHELEGHADQITAVKLHPEHPMLITGSLDGTVRIWNSTTYKLENIIGFNLGAIYAFGCISGSRRIMVGCHQGLAMIKVTPKILRAESLLHWPKPAHGWSVLSVAGSVAADGSAGVGMIFRSDIGMAMFSGWRYLVNCADELEAEACAAKKGLKKARYYSGPIVLQSSCANFQSLLTSIKEDGSKLSYYIEDIKKHIASLALEGREVIFVSISREQNKVAHCLANHARSDMSTSFFRDNVPDVISSLVASDRYAVRNKVEI